MGNRPLVRTALARNLARVYVADLLAADDGLVESLRGELSKAEIDEARSEMNRIIGGIRAMLPPDLKG